MNDLIVQFAILWGTYIGSAIASYELKVQGLSKAYDSEEALAFFTNWACEYEDQEDLDVAEFFYTKLAELAEQEEV